MRGERAALHRARVIIGRFLLHARCNAPWYADGHPMNTLPCFSLVDLQTWNSSTWGTRYDRRARRRNLAYDMAVGRAYSSSLVTSRWAIVNNE